MQENWDCPNCWSPKRFMLSSYIHTANRGKYASFQKMKFYEWLQHQHTADELLYIIICRQKQHVLHVRLCSMFTKIIPWHGTILILSPNVGLKSA
jgi:hypothetical protein